MKYVIGQSIALLHAILADLRKKIVVGTRPNGITYSASISRR